MRDAYTFRKRTTDLTLYEQRREETMRKARDFFMSFDPRTFEEYMAGLMGPHSGYIRMVVSYWEMAASLVNNGAIDAKMFTDANGEFVIVFGKVEPFIPRFRAAFGNPNFLINLEKSDPRASQRPATGR